MGGNKWYLTIRLAFTAYLIAKYLLIHKLQYIYVKDIKGPEDPDVSIL